MNIYIRGVNFVNKGAELMLCSIVDHFKSVDFDSNIYLGLSYKFKNKSEQKKLGVKNVLVVNLLGNKRNLLGNIIPLCIQNLFGLLPERKIDVILDASGFLYSSQWGVSSIKENYELIKDWKQKKKKIILMPQAFGPFNSEKEKMYMKGIIDNVDLIFARDKDSFNFLKDIGNVNNIVQCPDFTVLLDKYNTEDLKIQKNRVIIIPNVRMLDKTDNYISNWYTNFLKSTCKYLSLKNEKIYFLIHGDSGDKELAQAIVKHSGVKADIIEEKNPLRIKSIISTSKIVIGSRFHGLVSALSQSIPSLGTGWSHKYQRLFEQYDCPNYLVSPNTSDKEVFDLIDSMLDSCKRADLVNSLSTASNNNKERVREMWHEIDSIIRI